MKLTIILATLAVLGAVAASPTAQTPRRERDATSGVKTIATGLDNPRGLDFAPNGVLYVTEAGRGGGGPCFPGLGGEEVCWGTTGAITKVSEGTQVRVLSGLPSLVRRNGSNAVGPSDVSFKVSGGMYFTVGVGIVSPATRAQLPVPGQEEAGWLLRGRPSHHNWSQVADIAAYEAANNPDGGPTTDSNPNSVAATSGGLAVADAAGNTLLWVSSKGIISTLAVFPNRMVDAPQSLQRPPGTQILMQAVPTSVVQGPDGAFYVGQLTGFPFPQGGARVYRIMPGQPPTIYAQGFTNIIDIGFSSDGTLYVLEIAHNGLPSGDPTGALIRVDRDGSHHIVMSDGLTLPGGLVLRRGAAFISNCSVCPGTGTVLRVPLG